ISYYWTQIGGPAGSFIDPTAVRPVFNAPKLGSYTFSLVVSNGSFTSFADTVQVALKNDPPIANAGTDQMFSDSQPVASVTLDGSGSSDPENVALSFQWRQLSGW